MADWTSQYDLTDPSEMGSVATAADVARYNGVQRAALRAAYPDGPAPIPDDDHEDPIDDYIEAHCSEWQIAASGPALTAESALAARTLGRLGGLRRTAAQRQARAANARQGGRPAGPQLRHWVSIHYTSTYRELPQEDLSLADAKRAARQAWDAKPGTHVEIHREDGRVWTASQTHGLGMLWSR